MSSWARCAGRWRRQGWLEWLVGRRLHHWVASKAVGPGLDALKCDEARRVIGLECGTGAVMIATLKAAAAVDLRSSLFLFLAEFVEM